MKGKKTFLMYSDVINYIDGLNDHQVAQLYKATLCYANGLPVEIDDAEVKGIWRVIKHNMDQTDAAYQEQCDRNKENIRKRYNKKVTESTEEYEAVQDATTCYENYDRIRPNTTEYDRNNDNDNDNDIKEKVLSNDSTKKKTAKRFVPPSVDEVRDYCHERRNRVNADAFIAFYESNGWKVGKNSMKDWKAAVRTWEQRESRAAPKQDAVDIWLQEALAKKEVDEHDRAGVPEDSQYAACVS